MRRAAAVTVGLMAAVGLLVGCSGADPTPGPTSRTTEPDPSPSAAPVLDPVVVEGVVRGTPTRLHVGPVVTEDGGLAVLPVTVEATGEDPVGTGVAFGFVYDDLGRVAPDNLRVVDTVGMTVTPVARATDGTALVEAVTSVRPDEPATFHMVLAAPERSTVAVLVPEVGLVADVPVVDQDDPTAPDLERDARGVAQEVGVDLADVEAAVADLDAYRVIDEGAVQARETPELVTVSLAADVLFAFDSAELGEQADRVLALAAEQLAGTEGEVRVVGHTDDQGEDAYNRNLSEARAAAVASRLTEVADLTGRTVVVEGVGSEQPAVPGTSEEARALNRRVELLLTPVPEAPPERDVVQGEEPEPAGPVGPASEGVVVEHPNEPEVTVRVESLRALDRVLVGTLLLEPAEPGPVGWLVSQVAFDSRGEFAPQLQLAATGVTLLQGPERVFPLDYVHPGSEYRRPLAELMVIGPVEPADPRRVTVVWPRLPGDTVVVDQPGKELAGGRIDAGYPWRLTDVPVETP